MSFSARIKAFVRRSIIPSLCVDCKAKMRRKFSLGGSIRRAGRRIRRKARRAHGRIKYIRVKMQGGRSRRQKVMVLASGKYRFVKNR